jgi:hypothetical protein
LATLANLFVLFSFAKSISLTQTKLKDDLQVVNDKYIIYFKKNDVISAIAKIDGIAKTNNNALITSIKENKLKSVSLKSPSASEQAFVDMIKSNLGTFLLLQGKALVYMGQNRLIKL